MSRLLFLLPSVPEPPDTGARLRNRGLMRLLADDHQVDAIAFGPPTDEPRLRAIARQAAVVPLPPPRSTAERLARLARSPWPDLADRLWSPAFAETVRAFTAAGDYHAVQAEGIEMARYLGLVPPARRVYDAHNAEFLLQRRLAESATSPGGRLYSTLQWRRLARFERGVVRTGRLTVAVSQHDANQLMALAGSCVDVRVIPNAVDPRAYAPRAPAAATASSDLLFLGKLDFRPNAEALRWFLEHVLPGLPAARLFAVGASPPRWLIRAGQHDPRVAVTGYVENERRYLARCAALVLPLQTGGGSRLKALVAFASGVPVISTRVGMEGLEAEPDVHFLRAETPTEWIDGVLRLRADANLGERLVRASRELVERRYDWGVLRADVRAAYAWLAAT